VMAASLTTAHGESAAGRERQVRSVPQPTQVDQLAQFVCGARFEEISEPACEQLKLRVLDSLGCALGALDGEPVGMVAEQVREFGGAPLGTLIGAGKSAFAARVKRAASDLGANTFQRLRYVVLPLIMPAVFAGPSGIAARSVASA